ncbi:hypothetical protein RE6C_03300 [Rhodopirellula europaea 6C]|uniref:Uncharacterized protein n=1 Tax=Rhodopirellula europaea 6C TaxID=1263867 RepID=M2B2E8_9BACT|nr:hypothetical protein RE6C_03300 [Rhodopirellula europaea 6C]
MNGGNESDFKAGKRDVSMTLFACFIASLLGLPQSSAVGPS